MPETRSEHLAWAKQRALEYLDAGDLKNAYASMVSDLSKHDDFRKPAYAMLNEIGMMYLKRHDAPGLRGWITGFN
jgi:hypothetical protein